MGHFHFKIFSVKVCLDVVRGQPSESGSDYFGSSQNFTPHCYTLRLVSSVSTLWIVETKV